MLENSLLHWEVIVVYLAFCAFTIRAAGAFISSAQNCKETAAAFQVYFANWGLNVERIKLKFNINYFVLLGARVV